MLIPYNIPGGPLNLFTIGVTDMPADDIISSFRQYSVSIVADIRGSWHNNNQQPSNGGYSLAAQVRQAGIKYIYLGHLFHWKCDECEDCAVRCNDQMSDITQLFDVLCSLIRDNRIAIAGTQEDIGQCRRLQTVIELLPQIFKERSMENRPLKIWHILANGYLEDPSKMISNSESIDV